jgi:hypothetical protein
MRTTDCLRLHESHYSLPDRRNSTRFRLFLRTRENHSSLQHRKLPHYPRKSDVSTQCTQENKKQKTGWRRRLDSNSRLSFTRNSRFIGGKIDISSEPWPREKEEHHSSIEPVTMSLNQLEQYGKNFDERQKLIQELLGLASQPIQD